MQRLSIQVRRRRTSGFFVVLEDTPQKAIQAVRNLIGSDSKIERVDRNSGITSRTVEVFLRGKRVAAHQPRYGGRLHGTDPEHMPSSHRRYVEWTPARFPRWAGLVIAVLANRPHPEQGFRTCLGVLRLFRGLDPARAEAVAARAVAIGALTYKSIAFILSNNLDRAPSTPESATVIEHPNVRGPGYFH